VTTKINSVFQDMTSAAW